MLTLQQESRGSSSEPFHLLMNKFQQLLQDRFWVTTGSSLQLRTEFANAVVNPAFGGTHDHGGLEKGYTERTIVNTAPTDVCSIQNFPYSIVGHQTTRVSWSDWECYH